MGSKLTILKQTNERPQFCWTALTQYLRHNPQHLQVWHQHRARFSQSHLAVHCRPTHSAPLGRLYAIESAAQTLPKQFRLLLYGTTHTELDISGAHYEIIRRFSRTTDLLPVTLATPAARPSHYQ